MTHPGGRPTVVTEEVIRKLEEAFLLGCSDLEACFYADIGKTALYNYQTEHPEFKERKEELKQNPFLIARTSVLSGMKEDPKLALAYLERKKKAEFSLKQELEHTGNPDKPMKWEVEIVRPEDIEGE